MEALQKFFKKFNELPVSKKIMIFGFLLFFITALILTVTYKTGGNYSVLYYNLPIQQAGDVIEFLKKNRIDFKVDEKTGLIKVPQDKVYEVRMMLAKAGIPGSSQVGLEIFDKTKFGVTEFVQKINYLRAIQGELARSIETLRGIKTARVHIVIPKESLFKDEQNPATASVLITYQFGYSTLKPEQVKAIVNLVANSVEGLKPENVTVIDNFGNVLTEELSEEGNLSASAQKKLEYKRKIEKYYTKKIQSMLEKAVGKGKVIVRVNADIDFTKINTTQEIYDPENVAERSHEKSQEIIYNEQKQKGGIPGVVSNVPSVMAQQGKLSSKGKTSLVKSKSHEIVNYEISKTINHIEKPVGVIKRLSVAVLVDGIYKEVKEGKKTVKKYFPRSEKELKILKDIVKNAIGYDPQRKDQIEVANVEFNYNEIEQLQKQIKKEQMTSLIMLAVKYGLTILALFAIFFFVFRPFLKVLFERIQPPEEITTIPKTVEELEKEIKAKKGEIISERVEEEAKPKEKKVTAREKVIKIAQEDPDKVARLIKEWLRSRA